MKLLALAAARRVLFKSGIALDMNFPNGARIRAHSQHYLSIECAISP
jgi:hypothetical protein